MIPFSQRPILVVDDTEDTRFILSALLRHAGYAAEAAQSVEEAVRLACDTRFDLFVVDKRYPDGDGADLCRRLREMDAGVPIVVYSGLAHERDRLAGFSAGADAHVTKPNNDGLLSVINDLLKGRVAAAAESERVDRP